MKLLSTSFVIGFAMVLTACGGGGGSSKPTPPTPELKETTTLGTVNTLTPQYTFNTTLAGSIQYTGSCTADTAQAKVGDNTVTFENLEWWKTYNDCAITVTAENGKVSTALKVSSFNVIPKPIELAPITVTNTLETEYKFYSDITGTIQSTGSCAFDPISVQVGENSITFKNLEWWKTYSDCAITVTAENGKVSTALKVSSFDVIPKPVEDSPINIENFEAEQRLTPEYQFTTPVAGKIQYYGSCSSNDTQANEGENTITFNPLKWWITYDDCELSIKTDDGHETAILAITPFRTVYPATHPLADTGMDLCANFPRYADGSFPEPINNLGDFEEFKVDYNCADFGVTATEDGWDGEFVIPAGQDATHGRDAQALAGTLDKVDSGPAGYDFTKLDKDGNELLDTAADYACIKDNFTQLVWEVKTKEPRINDLHSGKATYLWYNSDSNTNGGFAGYEDNDTNQQRCSNKGRCDTEKFIEDVNAEKYCGLSNWRLPTYAEIGSIANIRSRSNIQDILVDDPVLKEAYSYLQTSEFIKKDGYRHLVKSYSTALYFPPFVLPKEWEGTNPLGAVLVNNNDEYVAPLTSDNKYEEISDAIALDKNTGLMWTRCPATFDGDENIGNICDKIYYWDEALVAVKQANNNQFLEYSDWRLPSIQELTSLQAFDRLPMINQDIFPIDDIESKEFWSSTPSVREGYGFNGIQIIKFGFYEKFLYPGRLNHQHEMLLVRGGK